MQSSTVNEASVWGDAGVWDTEKQETGSTHEGYDRPATNIGPGDDFDDYEEGQPDDDFGEFDDGFTAAETAEDVPDVGLNAPAASSQLSLASLLVVSLFEYSIQSIYLLYNE